MTIAACYLSGDGVVFGADSTTTMFVSGLGPTAFGSEHHYNFAQKIFQIGEDSTLAMTMWGLGNLSSVSYRTLIAQFADSLAGQGVGSVQDVARGWSKYFWVAYAQDFGEVIKRAKALQSKASRTDDESRELLALSQLYSGGFCVGGYVLSDRRPQAFEIKYDPLLSAPPTPDSLALGSTRFWGCPNLINRLVYGIDQGVLLDILNCGKWGGSQQELVDLLMPYCLGQPFDLPIREAIDWVHASIYTTIKTMKFSHMAPVCGGPVEVAVITTDRRFRWVRHKRFDSAIGDGGFFDVRPDTR
jgi:hypothetical protein